MVVRYINKLNDNGIGNEIITVIFPQKKKNDILTSFCNSITTDVHIIYNDVNDLYAFQNGLINQLNEAIKILTSN